MMKEVKDAAEIKHVIRVISRNSTPVNEAEPMYEIERWITGEYLKDGWKFHSFHYLGEVSEGYTGLWILVK